LTAHNPTKIETAEDSNHLLNEIILATDSPKGSEKGRTKKAANLFK